MASLVVALVALLGLSRISDAARIDAPCSACRAIAETLQTRIDQEPTRNHLDMRHRLDSQGQRYGRLIDYKVSELRVVELLENLCTEMNQFSLITVSTPGPAPPPSPEGSAGSAPASTQTSTTWHWERITKAAPDTRPAQQEEEARQKQLTTYCGRVLEEYDEEITHAIQKGELENGAVSSWLCGTGTDMGLLGVCPPKPASPSPHSKSSSSAVHHGETGDATHSAPVTATPITDSPASTSSDATDSKKEL